MHEQKELGFLGPKGTWGEKAAKEWNLEALRVPFSSHLDVLEAARQEDIKEGLVAIENSIDGTVTLVADYFIHGAGDLQVCGEVVIPINQCVFAKPEVRIEDVQLVISHPTGLGQCAENISKHFSSAERVEVNSTAVAVERMLELDVPAVAIAGKAAAKEGSVILLENFQDMKMNTTRFWVVGKTSPKQTGRDKTSLAFTTFRNVPGALLSVYVIFAARGLNLSKIESRPTKETLGDYIFLVDVEAHQEDDSMKDALKYVRACTPKLWIFGSYPRWKNGGK